jgi:LacI family transcriptional regulator
LSRPDLVAPKTRDQILKVVQRLHYVPHAAGRSLRSSTPNLIGAVIPKTGVSTFSQTTAGINDTLDQHSMTLIVSQPELTSTSSKNAVYRLIERGADGLILLGENHDSALFEMLEHRGLPYVLLWTVKPPAGKTYVSVDQTKAGHLAAKHLLELGHRHFAYVGSPLSANPRAAARLKGVQDEFKAAGVALPAEAIIEESHQFGSGRKAVETIMSRQPKTTAIICTSDFHALGVLRGLYEIGRKVPEDISVVSFNNNDFSAFSMPSITTIDLRQREVGIEAANAILGLLNGERVKPTLIEPVLVARESSGPVRKQVDEKRSKARSFAPRDKLETSRVKQTTQKPKT